LGRSSHVVYPHGLCSARRSRTDPVRRRQRERRLAAWPRSQVPAGRSQRCRGGVSWRLPTGSGQLLDCDDLGRPGTVVPVANATPARSTCDGSPSHNSMVDSANCTSARCHDHPALTFAGPDTSDRNARRPSLLCFASGLDVVVLGQLDPERLVDHPEGDQRAPTRRGRTVATADHNGRVIARSSAAARLRVEREAVILPSGLTMVLCTAISSPACSARHRSSLARRGPCRRRWRHPGRAGVPGVRRRGKRVHGHGLRP
jgi:hypothetical protein